MDLRYKIARLYYIENLTQQEIANRFNISRIKVHRHLSKVREEGIVEIKIIEPKENYSKNEIAIEKYFNLKECLIVPSLETANDIKASIGKELSKLLNRDLKNNTMIGVGWGGTIRGVIDNLSLEKKDGITIIPMIGGLSHSKEKIQANTIVSILAKKTGGDAFVLNCPAFVNSKKSRDLFLTQQSIKEIIAKFSSVSIAIVSIGAVHPEMPTRAMNIISLREYNLLKKQEIIGDVNANFFDKDGESKSIKLQDRIINAKINDLQKINNVIGVAFGSEKIKPITAALKKGLINTLITDKNTSDGILKLIAHNNKDS